MTGLVTCGVCGLVETGAAAGMIGPGCPRCGSRAVEFIEVPDNGSHKRLIELFWIDEGGRPDVGGAHVPMTRAA